MQHKAEFVIKEVGGSIGAIAMLLALTRSIYDEERIKNELLKIPEYKFVVTELGGKSTMDEFQEKTTRVVLGACLNAGLISKQTHEIHAVLHATEEAKKGILVNASSSTHLALKIAIVRSHKWVAVAIFGDSAIHYTTNHERAGLGIMHI